MSENFSPIEADVPHSHLGFRSSCRMVLNMFRDPEISLPLTPEAPLTPVSSLTWGLRNLSTLAGDTPRCCLDLSNLSNGEEETAFNFSPGTLETGQKSSRKLQHKPRASGRQCAQLLQSQGLCSTPSYIRQVGREISSPSMNKENEGSLFKHPGWRMPRSLLFWKRPPDTPLTCYTAMLEAGDLEEYEMKDLGSPIAAVAPSGMPEAVDGLPELCPDEQEETEKPVTEHLSSMAILLSGPLLTQDISVSEVSMNKTRLFRSPSLPEKLNSPMLKRAIKSQDDGETPNNMKQKHSPIQEEPDGIMFLKKTASLSDMEIVRALDQDHGFRQLIGDFSNGALNIHRQDDLFDSFLRKPLLSSVPRKRLILIFHCEYSSERAPKMCRCLREEDRTMNEYPALHYPELYVLQGGYKDFFLEYKELCEPQSYCPMRHQDFKAEMLKFRVKSKMWAGAWRQRDQVTRLMKL
ncbi:M-phase inducer phosphatase 3 isoform X4 [Rhineura floridana]|uniref:M-phase inducer phosphatase 3 isoform X4 n=1 Tax=Rhineura floridana TaxID=261503 RepID=UPI002AC85F4D|nr:M-phase inducer phosphatase 3 isoform X4 [Rhineura floridana]